MDSADLAPPHCLQFAFQLRQTQFYLLKDHNSHPHCDIYAKSCKMLKHLEEILHRPQRSAEAGPSSAPPGRDDTTTTTAVASRDVSYVPGIIIDQNGVNEALHNSKWRKAFFVDGELRWATRVGNGIGEKVPHQTMKLRNVGDVLYLAPKESDEATEGEIEAANKQRVETFLDKFVANIVAQSKAVPPPRYEELRPCFSEYLDEVLTFATRDGVIAIDTHGYVDNDFDNPGPRLHSETQCIARGYHSLMNHDKDPVFKRLHKQLLQSLMPPSKNEDNINEGDDEALGYESGGSEVSQDRCQVSPAYPICDGNCWLKRASSIPIPVSQSSNRPTHISTLESIDIYTRLEPGFTRVLIIEPGTCDDPMRCTLEPMEILGIREQNESTLAKRPLFEALSYTWGNATTCRTIECNGKDFGVTHNLFDALINIRLSDKSRKIWIDALCINQENNTERSQQVQYMYRIYRAATQVIVWLGNEADDSDFIMQTMAFLGSRGKRATIMRRDHNHECLVQLARLIKGIEILTKRPWFFRSWIRQEVAAASKVIVRCGSREVTWTALKRSVNSLTRLRSKYMASRLLFNGEDDEFTGLVGPYKEQSDVLRFLKKDWVLGQPLLAEAGDLRSIWYYHTGGMLELLMVGRAYDATDPRDKVYAILGIAEVPLNPRDLSPRLVLGGDIKEQPVMMVDYSASISAVYQHTAKYLINRDENLDILCILPTHRDATSNDLPSWTPDWRVPLSSRPMYDNWEYISYKWGASGFTKTGSQDQADLNRLTVTGFEIARIQQLHPLFPYEMPHLPERPVGRIIPFEEGKHMRRFAQSTRGASIVPSTAVVGDAIWILYGCKMPVILRPAAGKLDEVAFEVLGPCYVTPIMFGEAIEWLEEGQYNLELTSIMLI
ncbi:heterokaryon incompatibility protein-domain-containing protein [Xylariaceae sp. AK1471]|nr:heterokaryon incompatibility protein-domain-containing protein [Xylariaceae sp. AK1471]